MNSRLAKIAGLLGALLLVLIAVMLVRSPAADPPSVSARIAEGRDVARPTLVDASTPAAASRADADVEESSEEPPPLDLRALLREIAAAEEAIVRGSEAGEPAPAPELIARLENAVAPIVDERALLASVLELLAPNAEGASQLDDRETYGAIRAVYWSMVVLTGRGDGRDAVLEILAALPHVHPDAREILMMNVMRAAVDGELVLDASYLHDVLELRALFPDDEELFSELLAVIGESLSLSERDALFAVFEAETDDPVLAGLTIKNLLLGSDPDFGLTLAELRFDSDDIPLDVKYAIANAVVDNADVFSATSFLAERSEELRNRIPLWAKVGFRTGGVEALEAEYERLAANDADPRAREMLVLGMTEASRERLFAIAERDSEPRVIGQALLTASARTESASAETHAAALDLVRAHRAELNPVQIIGVAANTARSSDRAGFSEVHGDAIDLLEQMARNPDVPEANRRSAIQHLRPFVSSALIEALEESL